MPVSFPVQIIYRIISYAFLSFLNSILACSGSVSVTSVVVLKGRQTLSCNFPTEEILGDAHDFNFVPQFPPSGGFLAPKFVLLEDSFLNCYNLRQPVTMPSRCTGSEL